MPCVSAVFAIARCPFICPSDTLMYCIQTAKDIAKLLFHPGRPMILVFLTPVQMLSSQGNPFSGGAKYTGVVNVAIFD